MFLKLDHLKKLYDADNGVKELNFSIDKGEFVTLLGPSGCGKTTTLNLIGGFLKADSGRILLDGRISPPSHRRNGPSPLCFKVTPCFPI